MDIIPEFWPNEFCIISKSLERSFKNIGKDIDVFSETYIYLYERWLVKGLELPDKNETENIKIYRWRAKKHILTLARKLRYKQVHESVKAYDEGLRLSESDDDYLAENNPFQISIEYMITEDNEVEMKINKLLASVHKENQQLGLLGKCLMDLSKLKVERSKIIQSTLNVMGIKIARFYELERLLKEYLGYKRRK